MSFIEIKNKKELQNLLNSYVQSRAEAKRMVDNTIGISQNTQQRISQETAPIVKELNDLEQQLKTISKNTSPNPSEPSIQQAILDPNEMSRIKQFAEIHKIVPNSKAKTKKLIKAIEEGGFPMLDEKSIEAISSLKKLLRVNDKEKQTNLADPEISQARNILKRFSKKGKLKTQEDVINALAKLNDSSEDKATKNFVSRYVKQLIKTLPKKSKEEPIEKEEPIKKKDKGKEKLKEEEEEESELELEEEEKEKLEEEEEEELELEEPIEKITPLPNFKTIKENLKELSKIQDFKYNIQTPTRKSKIKTHIIKIPITSPIDGFLKLYVKNKTNVRYQLTSKKGEPKSKFEMLNGIQTDGFWAMLLLPYSNPLNDQLQLKGVPISDIVHGGNNTSAKLRELVSSIPGLHFKDEEKNNKVFSVILPNLDRELSNMDRGLGILDSFTKLISGGSIKGTSSKFDRKQLKNNKLVVDNQLIANVSSNVRDFILGHLIDKNLLSNEEVNFIKELNNTFKQLIKAENQLNGRGPVRQVRKMPKKRRIKKAPVRSSKRSGKGPVRVKVYSPDQLPERLELLAGGIVTGNNSPEIKSEAQAILDQLLALKVITNSEYLNGLRMFSI